MAIQYYMRAFKTSSPTGYVTWSVIGAPDTTGTFSGYSPGELSNIIINNQIETGGSGVTFNNIGIDSTDSPYTAVLSSASINVLNVDSSSGSVTILLPLSPVTGVSVMIKDVMGTSEINNITIQGNGNTIDGNAQVILALNESSIWIQFNGEWIII